VRLASLSDQHHHGGAGRHLLLKGLGKLAAIDALLIEKHTAPAEFAVQQRLEMVRFSLAFDTPVIDENRARHGAGPSHPANANGYNTPLPYSKIDVATHEAGRAGAPDPTYQPTSAASTSRSPQSGRRRGCWATCSAARRERGQGSYQDVGLRSACVIIAAASPPAHRAFAPNRASRCAEVAAFRALYVRPE
jgi:hypothetical protein